MKQHSALKTAHCRKVGLWHGMYSAEMFSARAYLRALAQLFEGHPPRSDRHDQRTTFPARGAGRSRHFTYRPAKVSLVPLIDSGDDRPPTQREHRMKYGLSLAIAIAAGPAGAETPKLSPEDEVFWTAAAAVAAADERSRKLREQQEEFDRKQQATLEGKALPVKLRNLDSSDLCFYFGLMLRKSIWLEGAAVLGRVQCR